jgi:hypothetical protein
MKKKKKKKKNGGRREFQLFLNFLMIITFFYKRGKAAGIVNLAFKIKNKWNEIIKKFLKEQIRVVPETGCGCFFFLL